MDVDKPGEDAVDDHSQGNPVPYVRVPHSGSQDEPADEQGGGDQEGVCCEPVVVHGGVRPNIRRYSLVDLLDLSGRVAEGNA